MKKLYLLAMSSMLFSLNVSAETFKASVLFEADPTESIGAKAYTEATGPTLAAVGGKLVFCEGDGTTPVYADGLTGVKEGYITLGDAVAGSITNDEAGNLLIVNKVSGGETINIYRTKSVTEAPTLFHSFTNPSSFPCGQKIKINGDIDGTALILLQADAVAGVSDGYTVLAISVENGAVTGVVDYSLYDVDPGLTWGAAPVNAAGLASYSNNAADGLFYSKYSSTFCHVSATGVVTGRFSNDTSGWGLNPNNLDSKEFNGAKYLALGVVSHFPTWGFGPEFYLYDVTDMTKFAGTAVDNLECLVHSVDVETWTNLMLGYKIASGDIVLAPVKSENKMYLYFVDHNSHYICGYVYESGSQSGVEDTMVDENAPVEYFNLQGVKVVKPENGIYVKKQGSKAVKVVL